MLRCYQNAVTSAKASFAASCEEEVKLDSDDIAAAGQSWHVETVGGKPFIGPISRITVLLLGRPVQETAGIFRVVADELHVFNDAFVPG